MRRIQPIHVTLFLLLMAAFILRVYGIDFGLPFRYHIDEQFYVPWSLRLLNGELSMPAVTHGPNIYMVILAIQDVLVFAAKYLSGQASSPAQFAQLYDADPSLVYIPARLFSALCGTLTVLVVYLLGKSIWNRRAGLVGAAILAFSFIHIRQSHFAVPDVPAALFISLALLATILAMRKPRPAIFALAGLLVGIAAGVKFTAILVLPFVLVAALDVVLSGRKQQGLAGKSTQTLVTLLLVVGAGFTVGFVVSYPVIVLNPSIFMEDLALQAKWARKGLAPWSLDSLPAMLFYPRLLLQYGWLPATLLGAVGLIREVGWGAKPGRLAAAFFGAYFVVIALSSYYFIRFALPLIVLLALFGGAGFDWLLERLARRGGTAARLGHSKAFAAGMALLLMLPSLVQALRFDWLLAQVDTRTLAKSWIEANLPDGAKIAADWKFQVPELSSAAESAPYSQRSYDLTLGKKTGLSDEDIDWYRIGGFDYLIASSFIYETALKDEQASAERDTFYGSLDSQFERVAEFSPYRGERQSEYRFDELYGPLVDLFQRERPGPVIRVYRVQ